MGLPSDLMNTRWLTRRQTMTLGLLALVLLSIVLVQLFELSPAITLPTIHFAQSSQGDQLDIVHQHKINHPLVQEPEQRPTPAFVLDPQQYADTKRVVSIPPFTAFDPVMPKAQGMVVPNIIHYVWLDAKSDLKLTFSQYLAMKSVIERQKPDKVYIHCNVEPHGVWWAAIRDQFVVNNIQFPNEVYGRPIIEFAHRSDILRILILEDMGGIYLDSDIFLPLDDLLYAPFTMGQAWPGCLWNSIILSAPHASFLDRFKTLYRQFNPDDWVETSSIRPAELASWFPEEIQVVDTNGFFAPDWNHNEIYEPGGEYDFFATGQYTYHGWNHFTGWRQLRSINPRDVLTVDSSFNRMVKDLVTDKDVELWESLSDLDKYEDTTHG